jgi:LuxR family maltose regulon positive regulatory protein
MGAHVVRGEIDDPVRVDAAFDLALSKLRRPEPRPGSVPRSVLVNRLAADDRRPVVSVVAPAGYGKTTLLSQWAEHDARPFAWVSLDDRDNDAKVLLTYVAEALNQVDPVDDRVFEALRSPFSSVPGSVVPRLAAALTAMSSPVVVVLDDVHLLHDSECRAALSVLAEEVPAGSQMVLAGRDTPPVRIARLRAEGRLVEVGTADLSLSLDETAAVLQAANVSLASADIAALHQRAEGWPVGLYLAALYLREGGSVSQAAISFSGDHRVVSEYIESEFLEKLPDHQRAFLTRSSALERMSGPLCDAVLDLPDAATTLGDLAQSNLLFVPLDRRGQWYRYHHLFGDMLRAELERREPHAMVEVRRRASFWFLDNDRPEEALGYSIRANDADITAQLIERVWPQVLWRGQPETLERWIDWMKARDAIRGRPMIAVIASILCSATERADDAVRWSDLLDRWQREPGWAGDRATEGYAAMLRVLHPRDGVEQMRADLDEAAQKLAATGGASTAMLLLHHGMVCVLEGDAERADAYFQEAAEAAQQIGAQEVRVQALFERSVLAMKRRDWTAARALVDRVRAAQRPGVEEAVVWTAQARVAAHDRQFSVARDALQHAVQFRARSGHSHFAVQLRIELAQVYLALADPNGARAMVREADEFLRSTHDLGTLMNEVANLRAVLKNSREGTAAGPPALTTAELRLLPLLCTHMTTPEIAAQLFLSRHTVRSQMQSIYRKLDANNRDQAIGRARQLQLVE